MTDDTFPAAAADEEALSAYLAGDMPDEDARAFERRLQSDPVLATRLDALAQALVELGGFDDAGVPAGYDERLEARLAQERATAASHAPVDLAARRRKRDRSRVWLGVGTAAAVLAAGAVVAASSLQGMDRVGGGAGEESGVEGDTGVALEQAEGGGAEGLEAPVLLDTQVALADEAALRQHFSDLPEAQGLLGMPVEEARVLQDEFSAVTSRGAGAPPAPLEAPADTSAQTEAAAAGDEPAASGDSELRSFSARDVNRCLETITANLTPLVPVRVESLRYDGRPAVAYVVVTASRGSDELDRIQVWVVEPDNCATLAFQQY